VRWRAPAAARYPGSGNRKAGRTPVRARNLKTQGVGRDVEQLVFVRRYAVGVLKRRRVAKPDPEQRKTSLPADSGRRPRKPSAFARRTISRPLHPNGRGCAKARGCAQRRGMARHGIELVNAATTGRVDYNLHSPVHLLVAYHGGVRRDGASYVEGLPRSSLRDVAKKLTLVPAGHHYREWHDPRTPMDVTYFYPRNCGPNAMKISRSCRLHPGCSSKTRESGTSWRSSGRRSRPPEGRAGSTSRPSVSF
jgi:hypothetical protein